MNTEKALFALLRAGVFGIALEEEIKKVVSSELLCEVYALAAPQGMTGIIGQALSDADLLTDDELSVRFRDSAKQALFCHERQQYEFRRICACLEENKIAYIPLKGSVIRKFYPQSWMRTSSDIDILVREEDLARGMESLKQDLGYTQPFARSYHDVSLYSKSGIQLELHFSLKENNERMDRNLSKVWEYATPAQLEGYRYDLQPEFLVFHVVAHAADHFMGTGCGARVLLDLWLLKHRMGFDETIVRELCADSKLEAFYDAFMALAEVWFSGAESTPFLDSVGDYILKAGFGNSKENAIAAGLLQRGGKIKYLLGRLWLPYDMLVEYYPVLQKHRGLVPACQVHRWFDCLERRRLGSAMKELKTSGSMDSVKVKQTKELFVQLGLV